MIVFFRRKDTVCFRNLSPASRDSSNLSDRSDVVITPFKVYKAGDAFKILAPSPVTRTNKSPYNLRLSPSPTTRSMASPSATSSSGASHCQGSPPVPSGIGNPDSTLSHSGEESGGPLAVKDTDKGYVNRINLFLCMY